MNFHSSTSIKAKNTVFVEERNGGRNTSMQPFSVPTKRNYDRGTCLVHGILRVERGRGGVIPRKPPIVRMEYFLEDQQPLSTNRAIMLSNPFLASYTAAPQTKALPKPISVLTAKRHFLIQTADVSLLKSKNELDDPLLIGELSVVPFQSDVVAFALKHQGVLDSYIFYKVHSVPTVVRAVHAHNTQPPRQIEMTLFKPTAHKLAEQAQAIKRDPTKIYCQLAADQSQLVSPTASKAQVAVEKSDKKCVSSTELFGSKSKYATVLVSKSPYLKQPDEDASSRSSSSTKPAPHLNFRGRGRMSSNKNMQMIDDKGETIFQMVKYEEDIFHVDFAAPLTAFQAFALSVAQVCL